MYVPYWSRSFSYNEKSVLTALFQYNIEVLNLIVSATTLAVLVSRPALPVPFHLSQLIVVLIAAAWTLSFILGFAISALKLLLVTHFHLIFPLDPDLLGRKVVGYIVYNYRYFLQLRLINPQHEY